jgi:hypothetical protein
VENDKWGSLEWRGAQVASEMHGAGRSLDEISQRLLADGLGPIPVYKALRAGTCADYMTAKSVMHRNLPHELQAAAEELWDDAEAALQEDEPTGL